MTKSDEIKKILGKYWLITDTRNADKAINEIIQLFTQPTEREQCIYCQKVADGAMLTMGESMAHATCVIQKLNELLDPDYDGRGEPKKVVGFLPPYSKLEQSLQPEILSDKEKMKAIYPNWLCTPKDIGIWQTEEEFTERKMVADRIAQAQRDRDLAYFQAKMALMEAECVSPDEAREELKAREEKLVREIRKELVESDSRNMYYLNKTFWAEIEAKYLQETT